MGVQCFSSNPGFGCSYPSSTSTNARRIYLQHVEQQLFTASDNWFGEQLPSLCSRIECVESILSQLSNAQCLEWFVAFFNGNRFRLSAIVDQLFAAILNGGNGKYLEKLVSPRFRHGIGKKQLA